MKSKLWSYLLWMSALALFCAPVADAQSGTVRPRRVRPVVENEPPPAENNPPATTRVDDPPANVVQTRSRTTAPATPDAQPVPTPVQQRQRTAGNTAPPANTPNNTGTPVNNPPDSTDANGGIVKGDTRQAYALLQQKQYQAALTEAQRITAQFPTDPEAWKIAGFAQLNLKQYAAAASNLQKAHDLLRNTGKEDSYVFDALAQAYFFGEQYHQALPLLTTATARATPKADAALLFYRGVTEYRLSKNAEAEKTFGEVVKANPKDTGALYFLGQFAYERNEIPAAINWLNRVTVNDANATDAWRLLTSAYLRRASTATDTTQAETDYLAATRAGEQLARLSQDTDDSLLYAQALIGSAQYAKAIPLLERATTTKKGDGQIMFMLGAAHLRAKNYVKATTAFEQAVKLTPNEVNIYRELGYAYEAQRMYAKALTAYQKGLALAPGDTYFQEGIGRVKPFAK